MLEPNADLTSLWTELLASARGGDDDALGQICERLREFLNRIAGGKLSDDLGAKLGASDIVQQSMLEACRDFDSFRGSSELEFRTWVKRLVQHNLIDAARGYRGTQSRDTSREIPLGEPGNLRELDGNQKTASSIVRRRETDEQLLRALAELPDDRRRIIELRHREGLPYAKIAVKMGMTEVAARKLWSRTIETLREHMRPIDESRPTRSS